MHDSRLFRSSIHIYAACEKYQTLCSFIMTHPIKIGKHADNIDHGSLNTIRAQIYFISSCVKVLTKFPEASVLFLISAVRQKPCQMERCIFSLRLLSL